MSSPHEGFDLVEGVVEDPEADDHDVTDGSPGWAADPEDEHDGGDLVDRDDGGPVDHGDGDVDQGEVDHGEVDHGFDDVDHHDFGSWSG